MRIGFSQILKRDQLRTFNIQFYRRPNHQCTKCFSTEVRERERERAEAMQKNRLENVRILPTTFFAQTETSPIELGQSLYHLQYTKTESKYRLNLIIIID